MPSPSRLRPRRLGTVDGLKVRVIDDPAAPGVDLGHVFRMLAKMMVRGHQRTGDHEAISAVSRPASTLTVSPNPRPDHDTNNEAA